jgi:hypothetical protein
MARRETETANVVVDTIVINTVVVDGIVDVARFRARLA